MPASSSISLLITSTKYHAQMDSFSFDEVNDGEVSMLMLCYNQLCKFRDYSGDQSAEFEIKFAQRPHAVGMYVCTYHVSTKLHFTN